MPKADLIIDTSIFGAAVALATGEGVSRKVVSLDVTDQVQDSARRLPLMVDEAMQRTQVSLAEINRIVVSQGPGSFTGIRVGIAYAYGFLKGLMHSVNPHVLMAGTSSLASLASHLSSEGTGELALFLPATKTTGYVALVGGGKTSLEPVDVSKGLSSRFASVDWRVLGHWDGVEQLSKVMNARSLKILDLKENARLALVAINDRLASDASFVWSGDMPQAIYLRKSTVEEKAESENTASKG